ncbi:MAG TPA: hypothetical protein VGC55_18205 [Dokdonella sp.]
MNTKILVCALSLALASSMAAAQSTNDPKASPPTGNEDSAQQKTQDINAQDHRTGNDLTARKTAQAQANDSDAQKTATINGQDSKSGNNLMANKKGARKSFDELNAGKTGTISMQQAKSDPWLSRNFKTCDIDKNSTISRDEYEKCAHSM